MQRALSFEEVLPRPQTAPAPEPPRLADRLRLCARILAAAADELGALERGELVKRNELATERAALATDLLSSLAKEDAEAEDESAVDADGLLLLLPQEVANLLSEGLYCLEEREEQERRMQDRWSSLEEDALKAIHVGGKIISLRAGSYPDRPRSNASLDLRF